MYAIQIIESVHIFHKTYKKSQTNIRHQVLKNMNDPGIAISANDREYGIIVSQQGNT
jgi:sensor domain CHASE-containing protein